MSLAWTRPLCLDARSPVLSVDWATSAQSAQRDFPRSAPWPATVGPSTCYGAAFCTARLTANVL